MIDMVGIKDYIYTKARIIVHIEGISDCCAILITSDTHGNIESYERGCYSDRKLS